MDYGMQRTAHNQLSYFVFLGIAAVNIQSTVIVHRVLLIFFRSRGFYFVESKWDSSTV